MGPCSATRSSGTGYTDCERSASRRISASLLRRFRPLGRWPRRAPSFCERERASRSTVFLARADHIGYLKQAGNVVPDPAGDDLPTITEHGVAAWRKPESSVSSDDVLYLTEKPLATLVPRAGLQTVDPARVDPAANAARIRLRRAGGIELRGLLEPVKRGLSKHAPGTPFVSVLHIDALGAVAWDEASEYEPTTPGRTAYPGEVLFSLPEPPASPHNGCAGRLRTRHVLERVRHLHGLRRPVRDDGASPPSGRAPSACTARTRNIEFATTHRRN